MSEENETLTAEQKAVLQGFLTAVESMNMPQWVKDGLKKLIQHKPEKALGNHFKVPEVSKMLHIHPNSVRAWIKSGKLQSVMINGRNFITEESIQALLNR